jgi:outer membrane protein OmpA-like peptidoglycan-associated protein
VISIRTALVAGVTFSLLVLPAMASAAGKGPRTESRPIVLAQADDETATVVETDPVAIAEHAVDDARAALREAMATGGDVGAARRQLRQALQQLDDAKAAVADTTTQTTPPATEETAETPPEQAAPPAETAETPTDEPQASEPSQATQEAAPAQEPSAEASTAPQPDEASPLLRRRDRNGDNPPRFGRNQPDDQPLKLPSSAAAIDEGVEIRAGGGRVIIKEDDGQITVRHDDTERFRQLGGRVDQTAGPNGITTTTATRQDGTEVVTVRDADGNILQRYRKSPNGQIEMLIGDASPDGRRPPRLPDVSRMDRNRDFDFHRQLPPLRLQIPQQEYIVDSSRASQSQLEQALVAPPVEQVERAYSLEEVRRSQRLRDKVRRVDLDEITFEFGSAELAPDQIAKMERVGRAIDDIISRDDRTVILIEGHTDAVGSDLANLALSDRRAETVAEILTYYFGIPPENLITQGYGEQFLKVPTVAPERLNRRAAFRNITWLLQASAR